MLIVCAVLLLLALVGFGIWDLVRPKRTLDTDGFLGGALLFGAAIGALVLLVTSLVIPIGNYGRLAEMEAFYLANSNNYEIAVDETASYLSADAFVDGWYLIEGSVEKFEYGHHIGDRILEWRDAVVTYNKNLQRFRYWDANLWMGVYYPTAPEQMKLLIITEQ